MDTKNSEYFATAKVSTLMLKFSLPCVISLVVNALYNLVDQIFIGNSSVGAIGNTATTIVFPLTNLALGVSFLIGDGAGAYMALALGKKENEKVSKSIGTSITIAAVVSAILLAVCFPLLKQILVLCGASTALALEKSYEYGFICLFGYPFVLLGAFFTCLLRADGKPKYSMFIMMAGAITNLILDPIFIYACDWGLTGAALATVIGQVVTAVAAIPAILRPNFYRLHKKDFIPDFSILWKIFQLGFSSFLTQISVVIVSIVSMNVLATYGAQSKYGADDPQALIGITNKVFTIFGNTAVGVTGGMMPIVGYNYGAKNYARVKEVYKKVMLVVASIGLVATILFETIPGSIVQLFGTNSSNPEAYLELGILTIRIYLCTFLLTVIQKNTALFFQSMGHPVQATILSLARDLFAFVPLMLLLPISMGLVGVLWAAPIADAIALVPTAILMGIEWKKLSKPVSIETKETASLEGGKESQ